MKKRGRGQETSLLESREPHLPRLSSLRFKGDQLFFALTVAASSTVLIIMALLIIKIYDGAAPVFDRFGFGFLTSV